MARQERLPSGDVVTTVDRVDSEASSTLTLPALLVDGDNVTHSQSELKDLAVTAEGAGARQGRRSACPQVQNKTGYRKRGGARRADELRVTGIRNREVDLMARQEGASSTRNNGLQRPASLQG